MNEDYVGLDDYVRSDPTIQAIEDVGDKVESIDNGTLMEFKVSTDRHFRNIETLLFLIGVMLGWIIYKL